MTLFLNDEVIILNTLLCGENIKIADILTADKGRMSLLYPNSKKMRYIVQPGNILQVSWRYREKNNMASLSEAELVFSGVGVTLEHPSAIMMLNVLLTLTRLGVGELEPCVNLYNLIKLLIKNPVITGAIHRRNYINFEITLLTNSGFGLDLRHCVVTGECNNLFYISPKTGKAVSMSAGAPYDKLLFRMPRMFMSEGYEVCSHGNFIEAMKLTRFFINKWLCRLHNKKLPECRLELERYYAGNV